MTARDFCYWLQGYIEVNTAGEFSNKGLTVAQMAIVARHLSMVFAHDIDPKAGSQEVQNKLNHLHDPYGTDGVSVRC